MADAVGVDVIRAVQGASRYARSYAFLYAAFQKNSSESATVKDAADCLIPFIAAYTNQVIGKQVRSEEVQRFLRSHFGFDIPIYAIERTFPDLQRMEFIEFKQGAKIWVAKPKENSFTVTKEEFDTDFDEIVLLLESYSKKIGFNTDPPSGDWGAAIISFLKPDISASSRVTINLKGAIIDPRETERKVVAAFIQQLWDEQPNRYEKVVKIFMGVLVEDFLSGISEVSGIDNSDPPIVFYDTAILLRLLGCSGVLHKAAVSELTRYLQDIGCQIRFLPGNENEVNNVLNTILSVADSGGELEGETADAISRGEVHVSDLRMLQNNFVEDLARFNVFEFQQTGIALALKNFQIDELGFSKYLSEEAANRGRNYGLQNRQNDAGYLGTIMRLRQGIKSRDFAKSKYVFVTQNSMLAYTSRKYLVAQKHITDSQCGAILHVNQVATIAWLIKDQKLNSDLAARELLVNCYAAARPNAEWFKFFRQGIEKAVGDVSEFSKNESNTFVLQATRRIAQEQSFSNSAVMRQLNVAEIIDQARQMSETHEQQIMTKNMEKEKEMESEFLRKIGENEEKYKNDIAARENAIAKISKEQAIADIHKKIRLEAEKTAVFMVRVFQVLLALLFLGSLGIDLGHFMSSNNYVKYSISAVLGVVSLVSFIDLLGVHFLSERIDFFRGWIANSLEEFNIKKYL